MLFMFVDLHYNVWMCINLLSSASLRCLRLILLKAISSSTGKHRFSFSGRIMVVQRVRLYKVVSPTESRGVWTDNNNGTEPQNWKTVHYGHNLSCIITLEQTGLWCAEFKKTIIISFDIGFSGCIYFQTQKPHEINLLWVLMYCYQ